MAMLAQLHAGMNADELLTYRAMRDKEPAAHRLAVQVLP